MLQSCFKRRGVDSARQGAVPSFRFDAAAGLSRRDAVNTMRLCSNPNTVLSPGTTQRPDDAADVYEGASGGIQGDIPSIIRP